jgi:prepilin-type N-terminal cleavage/methylation domain-containing protein
MTKFAMPLTTAFAEDHSAARSSRGFTLVELAIVLLIVGLLLGSLVSPLSAQLDQRNYNETQQQINEIREALIGFAVTNGRLPRPATSVTDGTENPVLCASDAACTFFIPWTTLGVKKTDAWNKMLRYSVTPAYAAAVPFTMNTAGSKKVQTRDSAGALSYLIGSAAACAPPPATPCAPAVIYSAGKSNWGFSEDGTALPDGSATNADEDINAAATTIFFSRNQSTVPIGGEFDDIVVWVPPYVLMNRMVTAGRLP